MGMSSHISCRKVPMKKEKKAITKAGGRKGVDRIGADDAGQLPDEGREASAQGLDGDEGRVRRPVPGRHVATGQAR